MPLHPLKPAYEARRLSELVRALTVRRELKARDSWRRSEIEALQRVRLKETVADAVAHSRLYRDLYASLPKHDNVELQRLPVVSKSQLMERFDDWVTDSRLRLSALQEQLAGFEGPDGYYAGRYRVLTTSGTTGRTGVFVFARREWSVLQAQQLRLMDVVGVGLRFRLGRRMRVAVISAGHPLHIMYRTSVSVDIGATNILGLNTTTPLPKLVEALNRFQPDWLYAYPSIASLLADEQLQGRLHISPRAVSTAAELRTPEMAERMTTAWGSRPFNMYAVTEAGMLGMECERHHVHLLDDETLFEVVDEDNRPVPPDEPGHKLLITSLYRRTQPLIRYEISDMVTLSSEPCSCGRPLPVLRSLEGRSDDILYLADGKGGEVPVHPAHFRSPFAVETEVREYQVIQREREILVRVVPADEANRTVLRDRVASRLKQELRLAGAAPPQLCVEMVEAIARDPAKRSKLQLVSSELRRP